MSSKFYYYQSEADNAIASELLVKDKCLVKMFCGTGKSRLMRNCQVVQNKPLVVFVFPSLALISQFNGKELHDFPPEDVLRISSEIESTTNTDHIREFLAKPINKMICITYQSFNTLLDCLGDVRIDVCIFDEAHHAVGETYQKLIFENAVCKKQIFLTATPKNANGIVMYDREHPDSGMCGRLVYDYSYLRGINEDYLNPIEIRIDTYTENINKSVYECIARSVLTSGNARVLTFHSDVNGDRDTSVKKFVNAAEFKRVFKAVQKDEFPKIKTYKNIQMIGLSSDVKPEKRREILEEFEYTPDTDVVVISSCETIGEGVDTKNANMCVFVDPKTSYVKIIQNIGRVVRKLLGQAKPNSTVLIPCWVDKTKYLECGGDKEKRDEVIRQDMNNDGNFNGILNVLSALKQEDEDLYDICLNYPDTFSPQEIEGNLERNGYTIVEQVGDGTLKETLEHLGLELDYDDDDEYETEEERIMSMAEQNEVCIEIHTNSLETPVERYNGECEEVVRMYKTTDEDTGEEVYCPIVEKTTGEKRTRGIVNGPSRENRMRMNIHSNPDVKVLWNITSDIDLTKDICSCVIDCEVVDNWYENLEKLKTFIDTHNKIPSIRSKDKTEKRLCEWMYRQNQIYKNKEGLMKDEAKYNLWTAFMEEYTEYLKTFDRIWYETFEKVKTFIDTHNKRPSSSSKEKTEKQLGSWVSNQNKYYKYHQYALNDEIKYNEWTTFLEKYKDYFKHTDEVWNEKFEKVKTFIDTNNKRPSQDSKTQTEKQLGKWVSHHNKNYKTKKESMNDPKKYKLWTAFLEKYKEYFKSDNDIWYETFKKVKSFMDTNNKRPSEDSKDKTERRLGSWVSTQILNYKTQKKSMKDETKYNEWTSFMEEYKEYFKSYNDIWYETFKKVKSFMDTNQKRPSRTSKDKTEQQLLTWIEIQDRQYQTREYAMSDPNKYKLWTEFLDKVWYEHFENVKTFMISNKNRPNTHSSDETEKQLGSWISNQNKNYKTKKHSMNDPEKYNLWTAFLEEYKKYMSPTKTKTPKKKSMKLNTSTFVSSTEHTESPEQKRQRTKSVLSELHQKYKTLTSDHLNTLFHTNTNLWKEYHAISEENESTFPEAEIPRNRIIHALSQIKTTRTKRVVDMGCGKAQIAKHFQHDSRFEFLNYDHVACDDTVVSCDISKTPLEDNSVEICILSLAMWGSNCDQYIQEAYRILESGGKLYIIEPSKRWAVKDADGNPIPETEGERLKKKINDAGFKIIDESIKKFCMFGAYKH